MDLCSGFWQIEMAPEDREKTAFATSLGLYQWCMYAVRPREFSINLSTLHGGCSTRFAVG
ncbi:hypothetical protein DPMN_153506 [Dreissena polymorpha]|uniref:Reverse transcriptase n=1 Tax=Dreissena polymorpha TaxID=45954 RepID=A0A9D4FKA0_DREPO|nr:hypothetical protein DPMN_153506 [Dreissena polymorpha]